MSGKFTPPLFENNGAAVLTGLKVGEKVGRYAILAVRDPLGFSADPADVVAERLEDRKVLCRNPMYTTISGVYKGGRSSSAPPEAADQTLRSH